MSPKPRWRWWLWCVVFELWSATEWDWACRLQSWCVLPEWVCEPGAEPATGEWP